MRPDCPSKHHLAARLANVLRRFEHEGGAIEQLARAVGETPRDLRRWADGVTLPGHVLVALLGELPRHLADALIRPTGLRLVAIDAEGEANALLVAAQLNHLAGTIARAAADGRIDHRERAAIGQLAQATITELQPLAGE
jgi:predicted transcriptional regulator